MRIFRHGSKGFTLVEIMIVVAIIALIAAIAIPNLLRARHNANEAAAISNMRTLVSALESYRAAQTPPGYSADLATLGTENPPYVDGVLANDPATKQGFTFTYVNVDADQYTLTAAPVTPNVSGTRGFFVDESGVIRVAADGAADAASMPLE